jgi:hypothetical protein
VLPLGQINDLAGKTVRQQAGKSGDEVFHTGGRITVILLLR